MITLWNSEQKAWVTSLWKWFKIITFTGRDNGVDDCGYCQKYFYIESEFCSDTCTLNCNEKKWYNKTMDKVIMKRFLRKRTLTQNNFDICRTIIKGYYYSWLMFLKILIMPILHPVIFHKGE